MSVVARLLPLAAALLLSPLLLGIIGRIKARVGGRKGAPLLQPYWDLARLAAKGEVLSGTATGVFRLGPVVGLASAVVALLLLPLGPFPAAAAFPGDIVLMVYLLALGRFGLMAAALDTGSSFEGMGASREGTFSALAEPALLLVLCGLAWSRGEATLAACLGGFTGGFAASTLPARALLSGALFLVLLAENCRIPVDDPATHLELTMIHEVMVLDHSGPTFGIVQYAAGLKLWLFEVLLVSPWLPGMRSPWASAALLLGALGLTAVAVGLVESLTARLRLSQVPRFLGLAGVLAALGDLVLLTAGRP